MRNGGWVTPQLDNIPEKEIFIDQWVNLNPQHMRANQGQRYRNILPW